MKKFLRMTVLIVVLMAQLLAGVNVGVSAETIQDTVDKITALTLIDAAEKVEIDETDWGPMITSINGLAAEGTYYWAFYVNGEEASEGAGTYIPKVDDTLSYRYISWEDDSKTFTTEETIKIVGLTSESTALSLLQESETIEIEETDWGPMLTSINGLAAKGTFYWAFYVNGEEASVGAGAYKPKAGDALTFIYKSWAEESDEILPGGKYTIAGIPISNNPPDGGTTPEKPDEQFPEGTPVEKAVQWIQNNDEPPTFEGALALRQIGKVIPKAYIASLEKSVGANSGNFTKVTDLEKSVIGLIIVDKDPSNFNEINLIEKIYNHGNLTMQGLNGVVYGLLALDSKNYSIPETAKWTREKLIQYILDNQLSSGGWSLDNSTSDVDMTAMTLSSLVKYQDQPKVKLAIDKAMAWLRHSQQPSGGFLSIKGEENSQSIAQVIIALSTLGINPEEAGFINENKDIFDALLSFQNKDGGFLNLKDRNSELVPTGQSLLALVSYERFLEGKGSIYDLSNLPPLVIDETGGNDNNQGGSTTPGENKKQSITISVRTHESTILSSKTLEVNEGATALSALVDELGGRVETSGSGSSGYVIAIDGLAEFDHGPTSGWKYSVNGYFPSGGAGSYKLSNGDQLEWVYVTEDKDAAKEKAAMGGSAATAKPDGVTVAVFESFEKIKSDSQKQNAVLNKEQKMSSIEAQKLKEALNANAVKIERTVVPTEETVIASPKVDEAKIVIPKDALKEQKTIKIEELAPSTTNIEGNLKSSVYQFLPKGTKFEKPVYISINIPIEDDDLDHLVMAWFDEAKNQWIPIPTVIDAKTGTITGQVDHFTKFAVIANKQQNKLDMTVELEKLVQHLQTDKTQSEWEDFGMARLGKADNQAVLNEISKVIKEANGYFRKITDYERYVLTVKALGGDPMNIGGYDLIEKIYNNERMTMQGTNGLIFALIALDSGNYQVPSTAKWNREKILADILTNQNKDGGFSLVNGDASDVDITAMAISSLVNYKDIRPEVKTAIGKAVNWLSSVQQASGGFIADGKENSESASQVIIALASAGIDPQGPSFTKANGNVVDNLLSYQSKDGGFANLKNEKSNQIASEQALLALLALDHDSKNLPSIYQFANQEIEKEVATSIPDFADVDQISDYALQSIYDVFDKGVMVGVEKSPLRFAPKQNLTRAQFTAILVHLLEGEVSEQSNIVFKDVLPGQWYYNVVMKANELGIVRGTSDTTFSPNDPITREQVAVILARAFDLMANENEPKTAVYNDIASLSPYNQAAIQALYDHNLMKGYEGGQFKPKNYVTREMGAVIAVRLSEKAN
ncbi:DUF4430 domain-containing protein [Schinkia azotoformans]|uniref:SLH domain-containing protein n=1 Tax=Schinkia azotoformans LMG 9581 TaxID=1131731 RepID=K6CS29_SCHAZ|nr:DUF4430 domain-containing protein [Schinkia azotoformans]EKN63032.1 hypothetical protein BAZO_18688 [Schinkia azotoformans LMG 9581]MEC1639097.1 DUF4430 domain-containing protein [Schinkia azotoformans]MEC1945126.1 DUF4430 domain-containing protein [Schinkia azotoformans]